VAHERPASAAEAPPAGDVKTVTIDDGAARRLAAGHLWVYRNQVVGGGPLRDGSFVRVRTRRGECLGRAMVSATSTIALRLVTRRDRPADSQLVRERVRAARVRRQRLGIATRDAASAYRLLHAEADRLPATVVDVYGPHVVVQTLTRAAENLLPALERALVDELAPASILARNDPAVRELEGLPREVRQLRGETPPGVHIHEDGVHLEVDLRAGHKTGAFLDQRQNRRRTGELGGRRVLDCFCYDGAFALHAAPRAEQVTAVDISAEALARARRNARDNGHRAIEFREANAFDVLREYAAEGRQFDLVILDPPAFAKNRAAIEGALRGYKEINLRAMKLVAPGGCLVTASCSYHLDERHFGEVLSAAAADARREIVVVEKRGQAPDHPVLLGVPETAYLKCWILELGGPLAAIARGRRPRR
jgi:23S rRNA (cytosine1962-C5)-methyltransferase